VNWPTCCQQQTRPLEDELATELIHRTSRSIRALTEPGRDFYESALHILDDFENAVRRIGRVQDCTESIIRVNRPPTFARLHMVSKAACFFLLAYPDMAVEMAASESPATIVEGRLRFSHPTLVIFRTPLWLREGSRRRTTVLVATPQYLTRYGAPQSPDDLNHFDRSFLSSVAPYSRGALALGGTPSVLSHGSLSNQ